jgi:hypothetical protein
MRDVDISTVDKSTLRDLKKVRVKKELPVPERVADFIEQIGNPYCFMVGSTVVKLRFKNDGTSCKEAFYGMTNAIR